MGQTPAHNHIEYTETDCGTNRNGNAPVDDALVYTWVGLTLRAGMAISFVAMAGGLVWWFTTHLHHAGAGTAPAPVQAPTPGAWNPLALLNLGLIALLATPVVALAAGTIAYALEGNRRYAIIGALVGMILLAGLALSIC